MRRNLRENPVLQKAIAGEGNYRRQGAEACFVRPQGMAGQPGAGRCAWGRATAKPFRAGANMLSA